MFVAEIDAEKQYEQPEVWRMVRLVLLVYVCICVFSKLMMCYVSD